MNTRTYFLFVALSFKCKPCIDKDLDYYFL